MLTIVIRSIIVYVIVLMLFRLMGKRQLGQMQPFELVLTLIIADLATIPMAEVSVPVLHGIVPLFTLVLIHFLLTTLSKMSNKFGAFISGKPVIIINPNGVDYKALKTLNLSIDDLFEAIRGQGCFSIDEVYYAIMETNGKISVLTKAANSPVTNETLKKQVEETELPVNLVSEGKILKDNLKLAKVSEESISKFVQEKIKGGKVKKVLVFTLDRNGKVVLQMMNGQCMTFENVEMSA